MPRYDRTVSLTDQAGNPINNTNPLPTSGGGGGGGGACTIADGADVCEGATTDVAVTGDNPGTVSAKLRGLNKILFDVWDSINHAFRVNLVSGSAGQADNTTFTEGTTSFTPIGGEYTTSPGPVTNGKAAACQITEERGLHVNLRDAGGNEIVNQSVTLLVSAPRTATTASSDQTNRSYSRLLLIVDVSAQSGGSVTPTLQVKDSVSGNYVTIWTAISALTAVGTYAYYFADGANGGSFKEVRGFGLPSSDWRLNMVHNNGSGITYSASAEELTK